MRLLETPSFSKKSDQEILVLLGLFIRIKYQENIIHPLIFSFFFVLLGAV